MLITNCGYNLIIFKAVRKMMFFANLPQKKKIKVMEIYFCIAKFKVSIQNILRET